jgi:hypothetical protein
MKDVDVERVLLEMFPVAAVLLNRGGWLSGSSIDILCRFPAEPDKALDALWEIDVYTEDDKKLHSVYVKAESIVGISCRRSPPDAASVP